MRRLVAALKRLVTAGLVTLGLAGCGVTSFQLPGPPLAEAQYTALYPTYAEICAVSQIDKIPGFGADLRGGVGGHSVLYLNGACLDAGPYPVLRRCRAGDPVEGTGISANAHFRNANWVGIPGRAMFYHGGLPDGAPLTQASYRAAQTEAERLGMYDGITFHRAVFDDMPAGWSERDWKYEMSVATDYAIDFGRGRYCARVPATTAQMDRMIAYLNGLNALYRDGKRVFEWNVLQDNCSHLTHNTLAAAGVWPDWPTHQFVLFAAFDFPVPKNEFINLMRRANDQDLADLHALYRDPETRRAVLDGDWPSTRPGALAQAYPARPSNDLYRTQLQLIFYDEAFTARYEHRLEAIEAEPRYRELGANLAYFADLYHRLDAQRRPLSWWLGRGEPAGFAQFYQQYYAMLARERQFVAMGGTRASQL